ncbi:MAG: PIN domain-containing protein [Gemmatimonadaceae bacterium]|nr:PIN domain-containing protein [Gemmatimonadaceae bacterium]
MREPGGAIDRRIAAVGAASVATSPVVAGELRFGAHRSGHAALIARVDQLLARLTVVPIDDAVARSYAGVRRALERAGTPIGPNDLWIAAQALADQRVVVTGNVREFQRVVGLDVEDWREA